MNSGTVRSAASSSANRSPSSAIALRVEQRDRRFEAEHLDVERAAAGHVEDALAQLRRAGPRVGAADVGVALLRRRQRRCRSRGSAVGISNCAPVVGAQVDDRPDDLGDHVAGLAQHDGVADADVLAGDLGGVVKRGELDGRPGDPDRLHPPERRHPAGAPDVDRDLEELGVDLFGRVLERDRPARRPRRRAEPPLQRHLVDLDDDAVDLVLDVVAMLAVVVDELLHRGHVGDDLGPIARRQAPRMQRGVRLGLALRLEPAAQPEAVADHPQRRGSR